MKTKPNLILGVNSAYHEPAACLIRDGETVAAAEEERFNRIRHGKRADLLNPHELPTQAIRFCLDAAGITAQELDAIGFSFLPQKRLEQNVVVDREAEPGCAGTHEGEERFHQLLLTVPRLLSDFLGEDITGRFHWIEHHLCHAASAYFVSPFDEAAILSVDGIGEATSTWLGVGKGHQIKPIKEIRYPNSLGFLWTKMSRFLGFGEYGQWKVMGLAGFGDPERYYNAFRLFVIFDDNGDFSVDNNTMQFRADKYAGFERLFGPRRMPSDDIEERHQDVAAALQKITNEIQLNLARYLHRVTGLKHLCQAGGVALNCIANRVILEEGPFENVFIQPAANDAGTALGACYYIWNQMLNQPKTCQMQHAYLGPEFDALDVKEQSFPNARKVGDIAKEVATILVRGEIVAWFQGRMEWGPRALGNRSILADPRRSDMVHTLNDKIKHREFFRPFAASVLSEKADDWFQFTKHTSGDTFMLYSRRVRSEKLGQIPAVTHIDGTSRIQCVDAKTNPRFHRLIQKFEAVTGVPMVLNTSFNDREPIICTPENAVETCVKAGIRYLAIGDYLVDFKEMNAADRESFGAFCSTGATGRNLGFGLKELKGSLETGLDSSMPEKQKALAGSTVAVLDETSPDAEALRQPVEWVFRSR
jgi:carbamoyltransferase